MGPGEDIRELQSPRRIRSISLIGMRKPDGAWTWIGSGSERVQSQFGGSGFCSRLQGTQRSSFPLAERGGRPACLGAALRPGRRGGAGAAGRGGGGGSSHRPDEGVWPGASRGRATRANLFEHFHPARSRRLGPSRPRPSSSGHPLLSSRRRAGDPRPRL